LQEGSNDKTSRNKTAMDKVFAIDSKCKDTDLDFQKNQISCLTAKAQMVQRTVI
jgi:hypothetical protein